MSDASARTPGGVLTFSENSDVATELLAVGRSLADAAAMPLTVAMIGRNQDQARDAIARGADQVLVLALPDASGAGSDGYLEALHGAVRAQGPTSIVVGSTRTGLEVAARLAQRLRVACVADALSLEVDGTGGIVATRRTFGGKFVARVAIRSLPAIATVPPGRYEPPAANASRRGSITELPIGLPSPRLRTLALRERPHSATDVRKAAVVVAAGRGIKRAEDLALLESLCQALGATLAGSRPITDDLRWLPPDRKIGLSGLTVQPVLYVACGISGQIEHVVGMRGARTVVAINNDPSAPIHAHADYSIVGDLYAIVPALTAALREARERRAGGTVQSLR